MPVPLDAFETWLNQQGATYELDIGIFGGIANKMLVKMTRQEGIVELVSVFDLPSNAMEVPDYEIVTSLLDLRLDARDLLGAQVAPLIQAAQEVRIDEGWTIQRFDPLFGEAIPEDELRDLLEEMNDLHQEIERRVQNE